MFLPAALVLAASLACGPAQKAEPAAAAVASATVPAAAPGSLPFHPAVKRAVLPNGLTYYVRKNARPEKRAVLWLVVDAGSVLEEDDQRGAAHFLEHMAFNGTNRFAKQEILEYLQKQGMRFGPDINAFTSFDETVYQIEVPTGDPKALERAVDILHEWAQGIALDPTEVNKERGVVLEERRLGRGAQGRLLDELVPAALPGSKYGARLPIGVEETLTRASPDTLRRFYQKWYRPELMAVVAVGDFDPAVVEKQIAVRFADLPASPKPQVRPEVAVPPHHETVALTLKDAELPVTAVGVVAKRPRRKLVTEADYRQSIIDRLFVAMVNQRFDELRRAPDAPFLGAGVGRQTVIRPIDAWFQFAVVKGDKVKDSLEAVTAEVARVARFGFTDGELDRARKDMLRGYQQSAREEDKTQSRQLAAEIQRHYLLDEAMPGIKAELAMIEKLLPGISKEEIQKVAAEVASEESRVIVAAAHASVNLPDRTQLAAAAKAGAARATAAYVDEAGGGELIASAPKPGKIESERRIAELGATEWKLSNGITVVLKPTDFQNDQVTVGGAFPGGSSLASDADFMSARVAGDIAEAGGFGQLSAVQLQKRLSGSGIQVGLGFDELHAYAGGTGPSDQIELMLQLLHVKLTAPRRDQKAFDSWKAAEVEARRNLQAAPEFAFDQRFASEASRNHLRRRRTTAADYEKVSLDRALRFYKKRTANLSGGTVVIVGVFDVEKVRPLVLTYIGGLPGKGKGQRWRDVRVKPPRGKVRFEVKQGIEAKAGVRLMFHGKAPWSREAEHDLESMAQALRIRLREELREEMGGVYGVSVSTEHRRDPVPAYELTIAFGCAPENAEKLVARAREVIEAFRASGPSQAVVDKVVAAQKRELETELKENDFWLDSLGAYYRLGLDPRLILEQDKLIARVTAQNLQATAQRTFGPDEVFGVLLPVK